jgi:hypothetical protein
MDPRQQQGVTRVKADDALMACGALTRVDHVDAHQFLTAGSGGRTPEAWAREILEATSPSMRRRLRMGWTMLGLGLDHDAADTVAGWRITHNDANFIRLSADSRLGLRGRLVTRVTGDTVTFSTLVQLDNPAARLVWAKVLPTHLRIVRSLVEGAAERTG